MKIKTKIKSNILNILVESDQEESENEEIATEPDLSDKTDPSSESDNNE